MQGMPLQFVALKLTLADTIYSFVRKELVHAAGVWSLPCNASASRLTALLPHLESTADRCAFVTTLASSRESLTMPLAVSTAYKLNLPLSTDLL